MMTLQRVGWTRPHRGPVVWLACLIGLLFGSLTGCPGDELNLDPVLEQYHQGESNPWQAYWQFQNFCPDDLWDPSSPCPSGNCAGALSSDTFDIDIHGSDDRDQIYFFEHGFQTRGPGITDGLYGILYGDEMWSAQNPWPSDPDHRVMSIRYYDRGGCSADVSMGTLRRTFLEKTAKKIGGDDMYGFVRQSLNTDRCGDPYVNSNDDYIDFEREFSRLLPSVLPPFAVPLSIEMNGGWQFATGRRCVDTRLSDNKQGNYVNDSLCSGTSPDYEWRWNQLKLENVVLNWDLSVGTAVFCFVDVVCTTAWWVAWGLLWSGFHTFAEDLENDFHDSMWTDNPRFAGKPLCQTAADCVSDPDFELNFNDMLFDVRCKTDYEIPEPPQCEDGTVPYKVPDVSNGCQLRPSRVTRVNLHPDRIEVVFLEKNEGLGPNIVGLDGYHFLLDQADHCDVNGTQRNSGNPGTGQIRADWTCNNRWQEPHELCDGYVGLTCADVFGRGATGNVKCSDWCQHDYSECCVLTDDPAVAAGVPGAERMPPKQQRAK